MEAAVGVPRRWPDPAVVGTVCLAALMVATAVVLFRDLQFYLLVTTLVFIAFNKVGFWVRGAGMGCWVLGRGEMGARWLWLGGVL